MSPATGGDDSIHLLDSSMDSDSLYQSGQFSKESLANSSLSLSSSSSAYQVEIERAAHIESDYIDYGEEGVIHSEKKGGVSDSGVCMESSVDFDGGRSIVNGDGAQDQTDGNQLAEEAGAVMLCKCA